VGGATAYFSKGKLVVPPLEKGWKQVIIPAVPEQTLPYVTLTAQGLRLAMMC
jgi:hypothetical protein